MGELREWDNKVKERGGRKIESAETESKHNGRVRTSWKLEEMSGECETQMKVEVKRKIE